MPVGYMNMDIPLFYYLEDLEEAIYDPPFARTGV